MMRARALILVLSSSGVACSLIIPIDDLTRDSGTSPMMEAGADTTVADAPADSIIDSRTLSDAMDAAELACPDGSGPALIRMQPGLCIDSTEVTRTQYLAFLNTNPSTA